MSKPDPHRILARSSDPDYERGAQCSWLGVSATDMTRKELIAFVGFLNELASVRAANFFGEMLDHPLSMARVSRGEESNHG